MGDAKGERMSIDDVLGVSADQLPKEEVAAILDALEALQGIGVYALAERMQVSNGTLYRWRSGHRKCTGNDARVLRMIDPRK